MKRAISSVLAAAVVLTIPAAAYASEKPYKKRYISKSYGSATPRQIANTRAYERGDYYETPSSAHVFGSTSWWRMRDRESGGSRR